MPAPSPIAIATSALTRLINDEKSYKNEYQSQQARIAKLEAGPSDDENAEYILRQERKVLAETGAMIPQLKQKIGEATEKLKAQLDQEDDGTGGQSKFPEDVTKANEAIAAAMSAVDESS